MKILDTHSGKEFELGSVIGLMKKIQKRAAKEGIPMSKKRAKHLAMTKLGIGIGAKENPDFREALKYQLEKF